MAVGVFQDDCGLTVVQYVRMDGEITLRIGWGGAGRFYLNGTHSGGTSSPSLRRTMSKQTLAMESIVMPLCITSLEAKLAIKGNRHEASR